ncbi:MAG TPA: NAD(P)/FAD-dependent oxidoreductase, partial [Thermomicrobiales bacterium]|nr:NAD(P)/FAD-dependent oxidoreductase [Thermomicrobiales bacterium]
MFDTVIVGGGTAGLSAALVLGRARRRVLLVSDGPPRNAPADGAHGFFTRDGTPPYELLRIGREQLEPYATVELREIAATGMDRNNDEFTVTLATGEQVTTRTIVLATGVEDELPAIPGFAELWGRGIYHCPYCHGWEVRDQPLGVYASGEILMHLAPLIRNWSPDVTILTDGPDGLSESQLATLQRLGIR